MEIDYEEQKAPKMNCTFNLTTLQIIRKSQKGLPRNDAVNKHVLIQIHGINKPYYEEK
jgi:hypothetical protein